MNENAVLVVDCKLLSCLQLYVYSYFITFYIVTELSIGNSRVISYSDQPYKIFDGEQIYQGHLPAAQTGN